MQERNAGQGLGHALPALGAEDAQGAASRARQTGHLRGWLRTARTDLGPAGVALAITLLACIALLAVLGSIHAYFLHELFPFDLDSEQRLEYLDEGPYMTIVIPPLFSAALLFGASGLAVVTSGRSSSLTWVPLGLFFAFMAADEVLHFHEDLEGGLLVDWQLLYLPLMLVAGACWLGALRHMWESLTERSLWIGGAASWVAASLLEFGVAFDYAAVPLLPDESMVLEETFEMIGSAMFLLALFLVFRRTEDPQPG